ncbi:1377_t:CDS:2 [Dentiscutata erythropus]|uniref:1377_t:CDS:1 n=1 Tax=Dentiscutata erythropus TaxID=1348616 RepID=A0A9N9G776_9GLOM|nr:1377_t:CDS:2 [Dentiscutata erythropus]
MDIILKHELEINDSFSQEFRSNPAAKRQKTVQYLELENKLLKFHKTGYSSSKKIYRLGQIIKHREDASVDDPVVAATISKLKELLEKYDLKNIYNINKTELFY